MYIIILLLYLLYCVINNSYINYINVVLSYMKNTSNCLGSYSFLVIIYIYYLYDGMLMYVCLMCNHSNKYIPEYHYTLVCGAEWPSHPHIRSVPGMRSFFVSVPNARGQLDEHAPCTQRPRQGYEHKNK